MRFSKLNYPVHITLKRRTANAVWFKELTRCRGVVGLLYEEVGHRMMWEPSDSWRRRKHQKIAHPRTWGGNPRTTTVDRLRDCVEELMCCERPRIGKLNRLSNRVVVESKCRHGLNNIVNRYKVQAHFMIADVQQR